MLLPALASIAAARFAGASTDSFLGPMWRDDLTALARVGAAAGVAVAAVAAILSGDETLTDYEAQTRAFLPLAMLLAA